MLSRTVRVRAWAAATATAVLLTTGAVTADARASAAAATVPPDRASTGPRVGGVPAQVANAVAVRPRDARPRPVRGRAVAPAPAPAASTCTVPAPTDAAGYQRMFDDLQGPGWAGGDQATSTRLPDGRVLWLFGDTMQGVADADGAYAAGARMVHSSFVVQDGGCLEPVTGPDGGPVVPDAADGSWWWPQHAVVDGDRLVVLSLHVRGAGGGSHGFTLAGTDAAVFTLPRDGGVPRWERTVATPSTGSPDTQPLWGTAVVTHDGHHYVYGSRRVDAPLHFGRAVHVARVDEGSLSDVTAWEYWDGARWTSDPAASAAVVDAAPAGWSTAFSVHPTPDGRFRYVTKENDFLGTHVVTGTSDRPTGPFTRQVLPAPTSHPDPDVITYLAMGHAHLPVTGGHLGSISRNSLDFDDVLADTRLYRPQFFVVPD
ncbi:DUF4185 domain-containing protein [Thalassiella azotivora]